MYSRDSKSLRPHMNRLDGDEVATPRPGDHPLKRELFLMRRRRVHREQRSTGWRLGVVILLAMTGAALFTDSQGQTAAAASRGGSERTLSPRLEWDRPSPPPRPRYTLSGGSVSSPFLAGIASCENHTSYGDVGLIGVQMDPATATLSWGAYMYKPSWDYGYWNATVHVDDFPEDAKSQPYPPHGSISPKHLRTGSIVQIDVYHPFWKDDRPAWADGTLFCVVPAWPGLADTPGPLATPHPPR